MRGVKQVFAVIHTREGHRPDLSDLPPAKKVRGRAKMAIGDLGPMGRILVRGEAGHDIIPELYPLPHEPIIDKPGKGAFFATDLHAILRHGGIEQLVVTGVTTEVCVNTTVREANDRGYNCLVPEDCVGSYFPEFQEMGLKMIKAQGGIFGWVSHSEKIFSVTFRSNSKRRQRKPQMTNHDSYNDKAKTLGAGGLERLLRLWNEHPCQSAHADGSSAICAQDAG